MSRTVTTLLTANSSSRLKRTQNGTLPHNQSHQKSVSAPSPTCLLTHEANQPSSPLPILSLILTISRHQEEQLRPPSSKPPSSTPYLATNTLRHNPSFVTNNLQHHFPNKAELKSLNLRTPNPPYYFLKHIKLQPIQEIFILSSLPPQKKLFNKDSIEEIIPDRALKKERA